MATPALHPVSPLEQEPQPKAGADVIQLHRHSSHQPSTEPTQSQDRTFHKLLELCMRHSTQDCFEYTPEIILARDARGKPRSKVYILPIYEDTDHPFDLFPVGYHFNYLELSEHGVETDSEWTTVCQKIGDKAVETLWNAARDLELNPALHERIAAK